MIRPLNMRELLPDRRRSWTQKVVIDGQKVFLCVGEYPDGRPGEIFVDVAKEGTFLRGVMCTLARTVSIALQCGASVEMVCYSLRGIDYPPHGQVFGSDQVTYCNSVTDWIASELEQRYIIGKEEPNLQPSLTTGEGDPLPEKVAGLDPSLRGSGC